MTQALFDRYVVVDWSARNRPGVGRDSIWIATIDGRGDLRRWNPSTRHRAELDIGALLDEAADERVLLGIDVGLGYPAGTAASFGLTGVAWRSMWTEITRQSTDDERNRNNRFDVADGLNGRTDGPGPFWGCPPSVASASLRPTKPATTPVPEFRATERALRRAGRYPKSMWQLLGAGSVAGQSLTAIPVLDRLLSGGRSVEVWPFTSGLGVPQVAPGGFVVAEVWPAQFPVVVTGNHIRDEAQVMQVAQHLRAADRNGQLAEWFCPAVDDADRWTVVAEEGWVLGPPDVDVT